MKKSTIKIHEIAVDGYPDMDKLVGRVAFLFDGCIVSGWPHSNRALGDLWAANEDVGHNRKFSGVTHWVEFEKSLCVIHK